MRRRRASAVVGTIAIIGTLGAVLLGITATAAAQMVTPQASPERQRRVHQPRQDPFREENQIRRSRAVTRRILRDRRASNEIRQQATDLDTLLDRRQAAVDRLIKRQQDFLTQHKAEVDELEDLRRRANELDQRLGAARKDVLDASKADLVELKDATTRAATLADGLRDHYQEELRERRRH